MSVQFSIKKIGTITLEGTLKMFTYCLHQTKKKSVKSFNIKKYSGEILVFAFR